MNVSVTRLGQSKLVYYIYKELNIISRLERVLKNGTAYMTKEFNTSKRKSQVTVWISDRIALETNKVDHSISH